MTNESSSPLIQVVSSMGHTTFLCAALHICAAHESAKTGSPIDWGRVCETCPFVEGCRGDWISVLDPIFRAAGLFPHVIEKRSETMGNSNQ